jgi:hypothetical protein
MEPTHRLRSANVPESRSRARAKSKAVFTPPPAKKVDKPNPKWWAPVMVALMILGLAYIVWTYIAGSPIRSIGNWNLIIGLAAILAGFGMTMRWK